MRRAMFKLEYFHIIQRSVHPLDDLRLGPAELQRPECNLVENRRIKKLHVGILEYYSDTTPKAS